MDSEIAPEKLVGLSESQINFVEQAAEAMAEAFSVAPDDFKLVNVDKPETRALEELVEVSKEDEPGYDGIPHKEAVSSNVARFAVAYSGEIDELEDYNPQAEISLMVGKWAFPVESYPPDGPEGVASIRIPLDI